MIRRNVMIKKMFTNQFLDLMASFMYNHLKGKAKTKANIKASISNFELVWLESVRYNKNVNRKK